MATLTFTDKSGNPYNFGVHPTGTKFNNVGGVYAFTKENSDGTHKVLYVGETESFRDRPLGWGHHKWGEATRMGITRICVLQTSNRVFIQNKLIEAYQPPLNER